MDIPFDSIRVLPACPSYRRHLDRCQRPIVYFHPSIDSETFHIHREELPSVENALILACRHRSPLVSTSNYQIECMLVESFIPKDR